MGRVKGKPKFEMAFYISYNLMGIIQVIIIFSVVASAGRFF